MGVADLIIKLNQDHCSAAVKPANDLSEVLIYKRYYREVFTVILTKMTAYMTVY